MVPAAFVRLAALPLTSNGKLDRRALPAPDDTAFAHDAYEAPRGETEQTLATIWQDVLGVERVGRQDHFFELGGHSLLAVQLMERLRRVGLHVEIDQLFDTPVLSELAALLQPDRAVSVPPCAITPESGAITPDMLPLIALTQEEIDRSVAQVPGGIANVQDIYALSPLQEGILFHHLLAREGDPYLHSTQLAFPDRGRLDRFLAAVQLVVDRHVILRTSFIWEGLSTPAQVVWRRAPVSVTEVELDPADGPIPEQLARRFDPRRHRLALTQAPLLRFVIAREPDSDRWIALLLQHHLTEDVRSSHIFLAEMTALLGGHGHTLPPAPPFRTYVGSRRRSTSASSARCSVTWTNRRCRSACRTSTRMAATSANRASWCRRRSTIGCGRRRGAWA
jgi:aryl carrier-like protein